MNIKYLFSKFIKKIYIPAVKNSSKDKTSKIYSGSHIVNVNIGKYSYIGNYCTVLNTDIGNYCSIADNCVIGGASHPITWVSSSPVFYNGKNVLQKNFSHHNFNPSKKTIIGSDVWIGNNSLIKAGIEIGDGAIVGMGAVVTKNIGSYEIWAGNPARIIRKRFDDETIHALSKSQWWLYDSKKVEILSDTFNDVDEFLNELERRF